MKVCPVCNESFAKELNFCDVDGTRLTRQYDASSSGEPSKVWQLLGVGLLLGALLISAASIFLPKNRSNPNPSLSGTTPVESPTTRSTPDTTSDPPTVAIAEDSVATADEIALAEIKKRERALAVASQSSGSPGPNPKAAALAVEESEKASVSEDKQLPVPPQPSEAVTTTKALNETREPAPAPKPAPPVVEAKETKKQAAEGKTSGKEPTGKKKADEKEKKGGFLRVFKKIFGKD